MKKENDRDILEILKIYRTMVKEGLSEINWERGNSRLFIKRKTGSGAEAETPLQQREAVMVQKPAAQPVPAKEKKDNTVPIQSPMNGIFFRASSPDAEPFVKEGDTVSTGQTICIIEAMKSMNEIKAEARCRVEKIMVSNAESVTAGQDVFRVVPL